MRRTPIIQIQRGNFRNFFLNHLVSFVCVAGVVGGGGISLIGMPFKQTLSCLGLRVTIAKYQVERLLITV